MSTPRREVALAIKRCLDSLVVDAERMKLSELVHLLGIAALAAEDAAQSIEFTDAQAAELMRRAPAGHC